MEERNGSGALETVDITDFNIWFLHHFPKVNHTSHFLDLTPPAPGCSGITKSFLSWPDFI
jgi:hypothetical protein